MPEEHQSISLLGLTWSEKLADRLRPGYWTDTFDFRCDAWSPLSMTTAISPNHSSDAYQSFRSPCSSPDSGNDSLAGGDALSLINASHDGSVSELPRCFLSMDAIRCKRCPWTGKTPSQKKSVSIRLANARPIRS